MSEKRNNFGEGSMFESDTETSDLHHIDGKTYIGYYRLYFRSGWWGRWFLEEGQRPTEQECEPIDRIVDVLKQDFPRGCDWDMKEFFANHYPVWGSEQRYLLRPNGPLPTWIKENYSIMVDTTYGNGDYPVRIYLYRNETE